MLGPMGQAQVVHDESGWTISFAQALVSQLRVDHALTLLLDDDSIIRIESLRADLGWGSDSTSARRVLRGGAGAPAAAPNRSPRSDWAEWDASPRIR
jgi:hypothetical protein